MVSPITFIVTDFTFRSMVYLGLILGLVYGAGCSVLHVEVQLFTEFFEWTCFSMELSLYLCENQLCMCRSDCEFLFCSIDLTFLSFIQDHIILITRFLLWESEITERSWTLFFLFKNCCSYSGFVAHLYFRTICLISPKIACWNCTDSIDQFGENWYLSNTEPDPWTMYISVYLELIS